MNALLVHPRFPITYWGLQYGLCLVGKRASLPPLGLLTVAALLPSDWHVRLVDLNVDALKDDDLRWADIVLTGGLLIQAESMQKIISRAVAWKRPVEVRLRKPRVKTPGQVLAELEEIHRLGYRGTLFFVDDNFIGNKSAVKQLLPILGEWQRARERPFDIYTEASVDLASDPKLLGDMVAAGFTSVFVGIETPSTKSLEHAKKFQNLRVDLSDAVERITRASTLGEVVAMLRTIWHVGVLSPHRRLFWRLMVKALSRGRSHVRQAVANAVRGEHLILYTQKHLVPRMEQDLEEICGPRFMQTILSSGAA
jgi:hypothetical protein